MYNQFTLQKAIADFGLVLGSVRNLFPQVKPVPVAAPVRLRLRAFADLATSEAGRAHYLIAPLIGEVYLAGEDRVALFPAARFDVDDAAGLTGICDFILGKPPQAPIVTSPVLMIVEAKNEDIVGGLGQCAAAMVAAQRFNRARNPDIDTIFGVVSDGERWRFLRLSAAALDLERTDRLISDPDQIYGILLDICGITPATPVAA
ncbi:MAG: hypothetical protein LC104_01775 [Bacteroidales bacterium]|nr:hypothetical protein [Bacteroidales bacterium]